jgi:hypothetical protein
LGMGIRATSQIAAAQARQGDDRHANVVMRSWGGMEKPPSLAS